MSIRDYQRSQVDLLTTKNIDMKARRTVNASDAVDPGDYVTKRQTEGFFEKFKSYMTDILKNFMMSDATLTKENVIPKTSKTPNKLIASDMTNDVAGVNVFNNMNVSGNVNVGKRVYIDNGPGIAGTVEDNQLMLKNYGAGGMCFLCNGTDSSHILFDCEWLNHDLISRDTTIATIQKSLGDIYFQWAAGQTVNSPTIGEQPWMKVSLSDGAIRLVSTKLGFFNGTPVAKQTLVSYLSWPYPTAFNGMANNNPGNIYASIGDLNNIRIGYESLRIAFEDLRSKLLASTLVGS